MTLIQTLLLVLAGTGAGLLGSLLGLGGGVLMVPLLVLTMKVPIHTAIATSLLCVIATSSAAASRNVSRGIANIRLAVSLEIWTVLGAILGSSVAGILPERTLLIVFAGALGLMSIPLARGVPDVEPEPESDSDQNLPAPRFADRLDGGYFDAAENKEVTYHVRRFPFAVLVSSVAGTMSGLLGIGGGVVKVPALTLFCNVPMKAAAATSNLMIGVTAVASALVYYGRGEISPIISAASVVGVFAGSRLGTTAGSRVKSSLLRKVFAAIMIFLAAELLLRALGILS